MSRWDRASWAARDTKTGPRVSLGLSVVVPQAAVVEVLSSFRARGDY